MDGVLSFPGSGIDLQASGGIWADRSRAGSLEGLNDSARGAFFRTMFIRGILNNDLVT